MKKNNGITLIALVITIIVMLILVTVTIRVAQDGSLFKHAANAASKTKTVAEKENALLDGNIDGKTIEQIVAEATGEVYIRELHDWQRSGDNFTCTCDECKKVNPAGRTLTIGQELSYTEGGTGTSSITAEKSGIAQAKLDKENGKTIMDWVDSFGSSQTISKGNSIKWVVLGAEDKNNNGTNESLLLTTENPTTDKITLYGAAAYNYWVEEANRIAKELYGNNARGMTAEDVNAVLEYTPTVTPHALSTDEHYNNIIQNGYRNMYTRPNG